MKRISKNIINISKFQKLKYTNESWNKVGKLLTVSMTGKLEELKKLIDIEKIEVNTSDYDLRTALHIAASEGHTELCKYLIEKGADINPVDRFDHTPSQDALRSGHYDTLKFLVSKGGKCTQPLMRSVASLLNSITENKIDKVEAWLLISPKLVNSADYDGRTPLHIAAFHDRLDIIKLLLKHKANINAVDNAGNTPINDALIQNHTKIVEYLLEQGANMPSKIQNILNLAEFSIVLSKVLPIICERTDFEYAEVWVPHKSNEFLVPHDSYYCPESDLTDKVLEYRKELDKTTINPDSGLIGRVWSSKFPDSISEIKSSDFPSKAVFEKMEKLGFKSVFIIPILHELSEALAITVLFSKKKVDVAKEQLQKNTLFLNNLISVGLPNVFKQKKNYSQMDEVIKIIAKLGVFDVTHIYNEVDRFYNEIQMPKGYFSHFSPKDIANHIHALIAAKKVALTSGKEEDIQFVAESKDKAYYLCSSSVESNDMMERKISEYLISTPSTHGYSLEYHRSEKPILHNGKLCLSVYIVTRFEYPKKKIDLNDLSTLTDTEFLARHKRDKYLKRYQEMVVQSSQQINPVFKSHEREEDGTVPCMLAFQNSNEQSRLGEITEIINSIKGLSCSRKFIETFSNGTVVYVVYVHFPEEKFIQLFFNKASLLSIMPSTPLNKLFINRKFTARQLMYAFSAAKFTYYFSHRESDEFIQLSKSLKNDPINLSRLSSINKKLKKDSITELRIEDCIFDNVDLVKEIFVDFAQICMNEKKPKVNEDLIKKINSKVHDEIDKLILTSFVTFNSSILKTNFYKFEKSAIAFRLDPSFLKPMVPSIYPDLPFAVFLIISSDFIGFHVRFSDIARGGIRIIKSSNKYAYQLNSESLFNENYGLANTQQRKNKDIPEGGSKGTILLFGDKQHLADSSFHKYIDALLDLLLIEKDVTDHYQKAEILFCGPDENTAHLMDWGALHAKKRGASFWKAFTTGKSTSIGGIPHDVYGMTTTSVHEYALGIYRKLGLDEKKILKCQTGGPDGDLGGNEILMSDDKTIAIIDGSGVLYDPEGINKQELIRLTKQPALKDRTISNFKANLNKGGFKVLIEDSNIQLPTGEQYENGLVLRNTFHLNPLFKGDIFIPCGGRPESVNINNVLKLFDKDGQPKFKYIVEGANLFITQEARIYLENKGVILFKDASANKGGVTSSSNEVLAALSFNNEEFEKHMQVKDGVIPEFYKTYVQYVIKKITKNARMEFECLWREHERTGRPISLLSDEVSIKINSLNDSIMQSTLWNDKKFVTKVMSEALPEPLLNLLGLETILKRVPENYLGAIFGAHLACNYVYTYGLSATEFEFYEFMNQYSKN